MTEKERTKIVFGIHPKQVNRSRVAGNRVSGKPLAPGMRGDAIRIWFSRHNVIEGNRFTLGELDGSKSPRLEALAQTLIRAGSKAPVSTDIRSEIWLKLWGNLSFNPISALTHATLVDICQFPLTRELAANMMIEAQAVAEKLGVKFKISLDKRIAGAGGVGKHKTSMLQDVEAGRPLELEALVGSVRELGRVTETPTPTIDAVYACASLLAKTVGEQSGKLANAAR